MAIAVNVATILPLLKQMSRDALRLQFEQEGPTYNMFAAGQGEWTNAKGWRIPSYLRPPVGVGGIAEGGSFNQPGAETFDDMYVTCFNMTMPFEITDRVLSNISMASSIEQGLGSFMERRVMALKKEANWQAFNDGSGSRATFKSNSSGVLTLYNALDHTPLATPQSTKGAMQLNVDERYDWYDSTLATLRASAVRVTAKTNKTATVGSANVPSGATDGDILVLSNSLYKMPRGLRFHANNDTGLYQALSRNTFPQLKAIVEDLNGAAVQVATFSKVKRHLITRAGVGKAKTVVALMSVAQDQALTLLGQNLKRYDGNAKTYDGSFDEFRHGDTVTRIDPDCGEDEIFFLPSGEIKKYQEREFGIFDQDNQTIRMKAGVSGYGSAAFTGAMGAYYNLGAEEPRCLALIKRGAVAGLATQVGGAA